MVIKVNLRRCWTAFCFSVPDDTCHNQIWVIHGRTKRDGQGITEFTSFMNCPWGFCIDVTEGVSIV
jgi:hypothetical protein